MGVSKWHNLFVNHWNLLGKPKREAAKLRDGHSHFAWNREMEQWTCTGKQQNVWIVDMSNNWSLHFLRRNFESQLKYGSFRQNGPSWNYLSHISMLLLRSSLTKISQNKVDLKLARKDL